MQQTAENKQIDLEDVRAFLASKNIDASVHSLIFQQWYLYLNQITEATVYGLRLKNEADIPSIMSLEDGEDDMEAEGILYCLSISLLKEFTDAYDTASHDLAVIYNQLWCLVRHAVRAQLPSV